MMATLDVSSPISLRRLCMTFVCKNLDKFAPDIARINKEMKDEIWGYAVREHLINDKKVQFFLENPTTTREIDLSGCDNISDATLVHIGKRYPQLQSINLSFCINVTQEGLKALSSCTSLHTISLFFANINDATLLQLASGGFQALRALSIAGCNLITDSAVLKVVHKCTELQHLDISHCKSLTGNTIKAIAQDLPSLLHFDMSWMSEAITDGHILKLSKKCHKLQSLCVGDSKVNDATLLKILTHCPKLTHLNVSHCSGVLQSDKLLKLLHNLTKLVAPGTQLTEAYLLKIFEGAPDLREIDVSYNDIFKDGWLTTLTTTPSLAKNLKSLNVCFCKNVTAKAATTLQQTREAEGHFISVYYYASSA